MNNQNRNKGSALIAVLVVLFILLSIFFAVFGSAISRAAILEKVINRTRASYLADAGLNRFLYVISRDSLGWQEVIEFRISEKISQKEEFEVEASLSGGFILVSSAGSVGNFKVTKRALIGLMPGRELNSAIINADMNYPLTLAGRTKIVGDVIVCSGSVTGGSIEGEAFHEKELVNGRVIQLPRVEKPKMDNKAIKDYIDQLISKAATPDKYMIGSAVLTEFEIPEQNQPFILKVENNLEINSLSFENWNENILIIAGGNILIRGKSIIRGQIDLISGSDIIISDNSVLEGLSLIAEDSILFKNRSMFSGQVISAGKIRIADSAFVNYPSLLYVFDDGGDENRQIEFGPGTYSRAVAVLEGENERFSFQTNKILIDTNSYFSGYVCSNQQMDIRGTLWGISQTESFIYYREPTTYVNWLSNAVINRDRLDFMPVLPVTFPNKNGYTIFRTYGAS